MVTMQTLSLLLLLFVSFNGIRGGDKLKCVHKPPKGTVVDADIIFVHGLAGDLRETWTYTNEPAEGVYFPDLLANDDDLEHTLRIWSYGYDNDFFKGPKDAIPLKQRAQNLLAHIWSSRINDKQYADTPIIFLVHSMGGLVVKSAMLEAFKSLNTPNEFWYNIYERIQGVIFYATPHFGAQLANIVEAVTGGAGGATNVLSYFTSMEFFDQLLVDLNIDPVTTYVLSYFTSMFRVQSGQAIKDLKFFDQQLVDLNIDFVDIINKRDIQVLCLFETKAMPVLNRKVVDAGQCHGAYTQNMPLGYDHSNICKPEDHDDIRYTISRRYIERFMDRKIVGE